MFYFFLVKDQIEMPYRMLILLLYYVFLCKKDILEIEQQLINVSQKITRKNCKELLYSIFSSNRSN